MGLTKSSSGSHLLSSEIQKLENACNYTIAIAGNPNVGKSTIFNHLTGMNQHTGNWPGKTVTNAAGTYEYKQDHFLLVDIPGTYSLMSHSEEEKIARNYICFGNPDVTVIVVDSTCLERNLNLVFQTFEITDRVIVCVNLLDEAKKKGISIDLKKLSDLLGVPVIGTNARKKKTLTALMECIYQVCHKEILPSPKKINYLPVIENSIHLMIPSIQKYDSIPSYLHRFICLKLLEKEETILHSISSNFHVNFKENELLKQKLDESYCLMKKNDINESNFRNKLISSIILEAENISNQTCSYKKGKNFTFKIDKVLTSKKFGIPIMLLFLGIIFWLTIIGANYPSSLLSQFFAWIQEKLIIGAKAISMPNWLSDLLIFGMYQTVTWVIAVMLPPMAIFFPLFTLLEDLGYLPRIAFNLDHYFKKACSSGKQALTMCMVVTKWYRKNSRREEFLFYPFYY